MRTLLLILTLSIILIGSGTAYGLTQISSDNIHIPATKKFFLDGGGDTFFYEPSPNVLMFVAGNQGNLVMDANGLQLAAHKKFDFDATSGQEYIVGNGGSLNFWATGTNVAEFHPNFASFKKPIFVTPTTKIHVDGGGDTYIVESAPNVFDIVVGGNTKFKVASNGDICIGTGC